MSTQLIDHNPDLLKLKEEGFDIKIISDNIVVSGVPYVTEQGNIDFGSVYCPFNLVGQNTVTQTDHTMRFTGSYPCDKRGARQTSFVNSEVRHELSPQIEGRFYLSSKPATGSYPDFYAKFSRYIELLWHPSISIDSSVTPKNFDYHAYAEDSVFRYPDTNTARAEISSITNKLKGLHIAIIGLGGTGSYILDFISKTPVKTISIFDGDTLCNHNAYRMPSVVSVEELHLKQSKVDFLKKTYDAFRDGVVAHSENVDETNVDLLSNCDFVFLSLDSPTCKKTITAYLVKHSIPFIDVGIGVTVVGNSLRGSLRRTLVTKDNLSSLIKIPMYEDMHEDIYAQNIQIAELNALNAIQAIIAWKKYFGFYQSAESYYNSTFTIDEEELYNEA